MRKVNYLIAAGVILCSGVGALAQLQCQNVLVGSPEDQLMLAYNGADNPQDQIAALDKYAQAHADSPFMPCVNSYYTAAYSKTNNFDKAIEYGEKDVTANKVDMNLLLALMRDYVTAGKATDTAFTAINMAPAQIKLESNPARPSTVSDADWQKEQEELNQQLKDERAYSEYTFFQLLPRVTDPAKRVQDLDQFMQAYPDTTNAGQVNFQYFLAYQLSGNAAKAAEYGEKAIAADPNNVAALTAVADDYVSRQTSLDKAEAYSKKVLEIVPTMQKPAGTPDDQFKASQNAQLGLAHFNIGSAELAQNGRTHKVAGAIQELKTASELLNGNPVPQARALFFLGYAYETAYPANHKAAAEAFEKSAAIQSPWQAQAQDLLAKVRKAQGGH